MKRQSSGSSVLDLGLSGMVRPIFFERLIVFVIPVTDTFFLSRVSDTAAGAVGVVTPVVMLFMEALYALKNGGANVAGRHVGAGNNVKAGYSLSVFFLMIVSGGMCIALTLYASAPLCTELLGMEETPRELAGQYLRVMALYVLAMAPYLYCQSILIMYGRPAWVTFASLLTVVANIALNAVVVFGLFGVPEMGVEGVALASAVAVALRLALTGYLVHRRLRIRVPYVAALRLFRRFSPPILRLGVPSFFEPCSFFLSMAVMNGFVATLGVEAMAARVYTVNAFMLCIIISIAVAIATQAIIVQLIGRGDWRAAGGQYRQGVKLGLVGICVVSLFVVLMHGPIMGIFTDNDTVVRISLALFLISALTEPSRGVNIITTLVLRASGDVWFITIAGAAVTWLLVVPSAYIVVFVLDGGVAGVFLIAMADEYIRAFINVARWRKRVRKKQIVGV